MLKDIIIKKIEKLILELKTFSSDNPYSSLKEYGIQFVSKKNSENFSFLQSQKSRLLYCQSTGKLYLDGNLLAGDDLEIAYSYVRSSENQFISDRYSIQPPQMSDDLSYHVTYL